MLTVKNLTTKFKVGTKTITAVDDISFEIPPKTTIGLVGESGSGKSITALSILGLLPANGYIESGEIWWKDQNILSASEQDKQKLRGKEIGLIFQNPLAALNPVFTIGSQFTETIMLHQNVTKQEAIDQTIQLLKEVNIPDPEKRIHDYPHQFSIGMCQRLMIALTIAMRPKLIIADEPTASLDVTIQAQVLELLEKLKETYNMSILMISHDLGVIAQHCDEIMIMYVGKIVESGPTDAIFHDPKHPYTQALLSAIPIPDPRKKQRPTLLKGDIPSPMNLPPGCRFHPRCPKALPHCNHSQPKQQKVDRSTTACFLYD